MKAKSDNKDQDTKSSSDQFAELVSSDIDLATIILKKWLHDLKDEQKAALYLIAKNLKENELSLLFKNLSYTERNIWKKSSIQKFSQTERIEGERFIKREIVKALLEKSENSDPELFDMIIKLENKEIKSFLSAHTDLASTLLNVLPPNKVSDFFSTLDQDEVLNYIQSAYDEKVEKDSKVLNKLKMRLREHHLQKSENTFSSKLDEMIGALPPSREDLVYAPLFKNNDKETILRIATKFFPYQLIEKLPQEILSKILKDFPDSKRISFLVSLPQSKRELFLNALAPINTPLREVTQMGIDEVLSDRSKSQTIEATQKQISIEFVSFLRASIEKDLSFQDVTSSIIKSWMSEHLNR